MLSGEYIERNLTNLHLETTITKEKKTESMDLIELKVEKEEQKETFVIYRSPYFKQKVFIETKSNTSDFSREELYNIEQEIAKGVLKTPANIFPNLLNPIQFNSANFLTLNQVEVDAEDVKESFESMVLPELQRQDAETHDKSLYGIAYPHVGCEDVLNRMFEMNDVVASVEKVEEMNFVYFYSFKETWLEEKKFLSTIEKKLKKIGIEGEVRFAS